MCLMECEQSVSSIDKNRFNKLSIIFLSENNSAGRDSVTVVVCETLLYILYIETLLYILYIERDKLNLLKKTLEITLQANLFSVAEQK